MKQVARGRKLTEQFDRYYPCAHTNFKWSLRSSDVRIFQKKAFGSRLWDIDDNEYIDYTGAMGPNILGHRHPKYVESLQRFMENFSICVGSANVLSIDDIIVAEKLNRHLPCAERVKFCVSGSEAVQMAIRLARAYTGRRYFLRFEGHYHGWLDNVFGGILQETGGAAPFPAVGGMSSAGQNPDALKEALMIPWNDEAALRSVLEQYGSDIAIIHLEALVCNNNLQYPRPGYLELIRMLCDEYGIVMSIDEVHSGFRVGLGGAQGMFGVTPDLSTVGKALAGGVPISAVVGKAPILEQMANGKVSGPGTFNGLALCMHAARQTLEILEQNDGAAYAAMAGVQAPLMAGLDEIARRRGIPMRVQGATGLFATLFGVDPDTQQYTDADAAGFDPMLMIRFCAGMLENGVYLGLGARWYMTLMHSDEDTERTLEAADCTMATL